MRTVRWTAARTLAVTLLTLALALLPLTAVTADPMAEAGPDIRDYTGRPVVFEGFGTPDPTLRIILYEWDFDGDGTYEWNSTRTGMCTNRFQDVGEYNATLRVTQYNASEDRVLTDTDTTEVTIISGRPVGRVTSSATALVNKDHGLRSEYYDPDGGILEYEWRIDGTLISTEASFKHTFKDLGKKNVTLDVTDDEGESVDQQVIIEVVEDIEEELDYQQYYIMIGVVLAIFVVAALAYMAILKDHKDRDKGPKTYESPKTKAAPIVTEASLTDAQAEPAPRKRPRVVRPERVVVSPEKAKEKEDGVPAAPARLPCSECGTTVDEDGECYFCKSNEEIDEVEKSIRELQEDGYILAKADEELEVAKTELHVKNFAEVETSLANARALMEEVIREHKRCLILMALVDELLSEARDRDLDVTKGANLLKLSKSFMKSGKYPKAIFYAERSRDFLLETLEPFDLDRYFCELCKGEVGETDDQCPHCLEEIESGLIKRAKRELVELKRRFEGISRDHHQHTPIAAQIEKVGEHVSSTAASAAHEHIEKARSMLDEAEGDDGEGLHVSEEEPEEGEGEKDEKEEETPGDEVPDDKPPEDGA